MKIKFTTKLIAVVSLLLFSNSIASAAIQHGSQIKQNVPVRNLNNSDIIAQVDLKVVTIGHHAWGWFGLSDATFNAADMSATLLFWDRNITSGITDGYDTRQEVWLKRQEIGGTYTQAYGGSTTNMKEGATNEDLKTDNGYVGAFVMTGNNKFGYTNVRYSYNPTAKNSANSSDQEKPIVGSDITVVREGAKVTFNLSGSDNSGDFFYYIEDIENEFQEVAFTNTFEVTDLIPGLTYHFTITPIDFSGNEGTPVIKESVDDVVVEVSEKQAVQAAKFLGSIGVNSSIALRGEGALKTKTCADYTGIRWFRAGYEGGLDTQVLITLHNNSKNKVKFSYGLGSSGTDIAKIVSEAKKLKAIDALVAIEGVNEPNNWGVTYKGQFGGESSTWKPVGELQRDLYAAVKAEPTLANTPVFGISEAGGQSTNAGLHYLTIPEGVNCDLPAGTKYSDYVNVHNYLEHGGGLYNNQAWLASDPSKDCPIDGLYDNHGATWSRKFSGYSAAELVTLPKVTTETGITLDDAKGITPEIHGKLYVNLYLAQYKRGWSYTSMYILRDRGDESGNQTFGFYDLNYNPRPAAHYLHNMTTILDDDDENFTPAKLAYDIPNQSETVHDLLLQKKDGTFLLVLWAENYKSNAQTVAVYFGETQSSIKIYDVVLGTEVIQTETNTNLVRFSMKDHPVILEVQGEIGTSDIHRPSVTKTTNVFFIPGTDVLQIENPESVKEIRIYSLTGNLVYSKQRPAANETIAGLKKSIYIASVLTDTAPASVKLIK
jgi:hypothetical protein